MAIVDLESAKEHLRVDHDQDDAQILIKLEQASAIVVNYLNKPVGTWELGAETDVDSDTDDAPYPVQAATLLVLGALYRDREGGDPLSQAVKDLLARYRDPVMA